MAKSWIPALAAALLAAAPSADAASECRPGSQTLFYSPHPMLDAKTSPGFADTLMRRLKAPLGELGYCIQPILDYRALLDTARFGDNLLLHALVAEGPMTSSPSQFVVALLRGRDWAADKLSEAISRPLVSLPMYRGDPSDLMEVLARKVAENLRLQYVAHVLIQSRPGAAFTRADNGLQGKTPVEWILPLGTLEVMLEKPGYIAMRKRLDLSAPGQHNYDFHLAKRRFYHSKFIYPAIAFGAAALGAYALQEHYYAEYQKYGADDAATRPDIFGQTFRLAKNYERIAYTSLALAGVSLALSFRF